MAIEYTPKEWKDYPDTSTPIMAADLNRIERAIGNMADGFQTQKIIAQTITQYIINGINALHPEYTQSFATETVETESDTIMTCVMDLSIYNPDNADGLLITADGVLIAPAAYTAAVENNAAVIRFFKSAGLRIGDSVQFYIYHKPANGSSSVVGEAVAMADVAAVLDNSTGGCILGSCVFEENRKILNILYGKVEAIDEEESEI